MLKKIIIAGIILVILIIAALFFAPAAMPDSPIYQVKRLEEKMVLKMKNTPAEQIDYEQILLERRLEEMKYVVTRKDFADFYTTSLRYGTTAGNITDLIIVNHLNNQTKPTLATFDNHKNEFKKLLSKKDDTDIWKFVQDDINYLIIYSAKLSALK